MTRIPLVLSIAAGVVALFFSCAGDPVSGPSTEEGNPQIVAVVVDSLKQPVPDVTVTAYRQTKSTDTLQAPLGPVAVASRSTDATGRCSFDSLDEGIYSIEATDTNGKQRALLSGIEIRKNNIGVISSDTLTLTTPGSICGVVSRGGVPGTVNNQTLGDGAIMVIIQEIEVTPRITPKDGSYCFNGLPPGIYTLLFYATDGFYSKTQTDTVYTGKSSIADTAILTPVPRLLPPKGFTLTYDTSASEVRLSWWKVTFDSLRWYEVERFDLEGTFDTILTTSDSTIVDHLNDIPSGTLLTYVIRSVDRAFNRSVNAGPIEVVR